MNLLGKRYDITVYFEVYKDIRHEINFSAKVVPKVIANYGRLREIFFFLMIFKNLIFKRAELIHAHSTFPTGFCGIILGKIFRIPVIVSLDGGEATALPDADFGDLRGPRKRKVNSWVVRQANKVIVLTEFLKNEVITNLGVDRDMEIIPRGIDLTKFIYKKHPLRNPLKIINVGYLHPVKDHETLLRAFSIITKEIDSHLSIIGKDYCNGRIQRKVTEMSLSGNVVFEEGISNDALAERYREADLMLHTSLFESQAVVVNEALACGSIVCGTHVGLLADLSEHCCLTVPPGDYVGLAGLVLKLLSQPEEMERLKENGYKWTAQHDVKWTADRHIEVYESCCAL
jgi:glycosyltransferase involved in cell wall biosynthesis